MPGITNPAEEYFKDGGWGWDGSVWRKLPLVWGYSGVYGQSKTDIDVDAGDVSKAFTTVPIDEVWVVTIFVGWSDQANLEAIEFYLHDGAAYRLVCRKLYTTAGVTVGVLAPLYVPPEGILKVTFVDCAAGDDVYSTVAGYKMKIAE